MRDSPAVYQAAMRSHQSASTYGSTKRRALWKWLCPVARSIKPPLIRVKARCSSILELFVLVGRAFSGTTRAALFREYRVDRDFAKQGIQHCNYVSPQWARLTVQTSYLLLGQILSPSQ